MNIFTILVIFGVLGALVFAGIALNNAMGNRRSMDRRERQELEKLRSLVDAIDHHAFEHRELDSMLAPIIIDEIRKTKREIR